MSEGKDDKVDVTGAYGIMDWTCDKEEGETKMVNLWEVDVWCS